MSRRKVKIMVVTPDVASRWLNECNTHNRPLRDRKVSELAAAMKRGEWKLTAEPIAFCGPYNDESNEPQGVTLINGQHRLWAIVESGIGVELTVWWGCEPDEFAVIDQGAPRTLGDVLSTTRSDLGDSTLLASVCSSTAKYAFNMYTSHGNKLRPSHVNDMLTVLKDEILAVVAYKKKLKRMMPRVLSSTLVLSQVVNPSMTEIIVGQLHDAVGFTERDPIRALHLYMSSMMASSQRDTEDVIHYKATHAIAARLRGDHIRVLRITGEGLGWLRDAARPKIHTLVEQLHEGRVPAFFYNPRLMSETPSGSTRLASA